MFKRPWIYISNPFETACYGSYISGLQMSTYLDAALNAAKADPAILVLYNYYHPIHLAYVAAYTTWNIQGGTQIGNTQTLKQLLVGLTPKVNAWDAQIQGTFPKNSPTYNALLPQGHTAFTKGSQSSRINAVATLDGALTPFTALASTKTDVHNYSVLLDNANNTQKGAKTMKNTDSDLVEAQRKAMALGQMYVYGGLVQKYTNQLDRVGDFFDLQLIRNGKQTDFAGHVQPNSIETVFKRTLTTSTSLRLKNTGNVPINFYLATLEGDNMSTPFVTIQAQSEQTVPITDLGDATTQHFLSVMNDNPTFDCTWEVQIL